METKEYKNITETREENIKMKANTKKKSPYIEMEMIKTDCKIFQDTITMSFSFGGGGEGGILSKAFVNGERYATETLFGKEPLKNRYPL